MGIYGSEQHWSELNYIFSDEQLFKMKRKFVVENVRQVIVPIVLKRFVIKYFIFMYLFYPSSPLK